MPVVRSPLNSRLKRSPTQRELYYVIRGKVTFFEARHVGDLNFTIIRWNSGLKMKCDIFSTIFMRGRYTYPPTYHTAQNMYYLEMN